MGRQSQEGYRNPTDSSTLWGAELVRSSYLLAPHPCVPVATGPPVKSVVLPDPCDSSFPIAQKTQREIYKPSVPLFRHGGAQLQLSSSLDCHPTSRDVMLERSTFAQGEDDSSHGCAALT